jgi:hypothetical protein
VFTKFSVKIFLQRWKPSQQKHSAKTSSKSLVASDSEPYVFNPEVRLQADQFIQSSLEKISDEIKRGRFLDKTEKVSIGESSLEIYVSKTAVMKRQVVKHSNSHLIIELNKMVLRRLKIFLSGSCLRTEILIIVVVCCPEKICMTI